MTKSTYDAVARRTRRARADLPAGTSSALSAITSSAGIRASRTSMLAQRSDERPSGLQGSSNDTLVNQGKSGSWKEIEIEELRRLVGSNIGPTGKISWVKVMEGWRALNLGERSKASLSSKWRDINIRTATQVGTSQNDPKRTQLNSQKKQKKEPAITPAAPVSSVTPDAATASKITANSSSGSTRDIDPSETPKEDPVDAVQSAFCRNLRKSKMIGCKPNSRKTPKRVSGRLAESLVSIVNGFIQKELDSLQPGQLSWDLLSILVYAGAMTVSEIANQGVKEKEQRALEWFRSSRREVSSLSKTIGKATAELNRIRTAQHPTENQLKNIRRLHRDHGASTHAELTSLVERLKVRLQLLRSRIKLRQEDERRSKVRRMPAKVALRGLDTKAPEEGPDVHLIRRYWRGIVGVSKQFDSKNKDLIAWEKSLPKEPDEDSLSDGLSKDLWETVIKKIKSWKAAGPDRLQAYWWKAFKSANAALYHLARHHLMSGSPLPAKWITDGRIVLLHKAGLHSDPANYRPIACLNTCYNSHKFRCGVLRSLRPRATRSTTRTSSIASGSVGLHSRASVGSDTDS